MAHQRNRTTTVRDRERLAIRAGCTTEAQAPLEIRSCGIRRGRLATGREVPGWDELGRCSSALRALADWAVVGLPAVAVVDEFEGDDQGDGEGELGEAVLGFSVGVSSQLAVVGQP